MRLEKHIQREMSVEFSNGTVATTEDTSANSFKLANIEIDEGGIGNFMNFIKIDFLDHAVVEDFINLQTFKMRFVTGIS